MFDDGFDLAWQVCHVEWVLFLNLWHNLYLYLANTIMGLHIVTHVMMGHLEGVALLQSWHLNLVTGWVDYLLLVDLY